MYTPNHFVETNSELIEDLIVNNHFATLIIMLDGKLDVTHIPLYLDADNSRLLGHIARANLFTNELFENTLPVKVVFNGVDGYISNTFYPEPHVNVPTWNYAVVHIDGEMKAFTSHEEIMQILDLQFASYEANALDWTNTYIRKLLNGIIGIEIKIDNIMAKFKLSQNKSDETIMSVISHLLKNSNQKQYNLGLYMQKYFIQKGLID